MFLIPPAPSRQLHPFLPDRKLPQEQEFTGIGARQPRVFLRQWSYGPRHCQEFSFSSQLDCKLLEYRNLTHLQLLQPCLLQVELSFLHCSSVFGENFFFVNVDIHLFSFVFQGQATATCCPQNTSFDVNVFVDPVALNVSQYAIHTVDTALHSWQQVTATLLIYSTRCFSCITGIFQRIK